MGLPKVVGSAVVGGLLGAAIWFAVSHGTGYEVGWIAWGVGALTGLAVRLVVKDRAGLSSGLIAGAVALAAIGLGKYATARMLVENAIGNLKMPEVTDDDILVHVADEVVGEFEDQKKKLAWPAGKSIDNATQEADYPKAVWAEARKRFDKLPPEERAKRREEVTRNQREFVDQFRGAAHSVATSSMFGPKDVLWCFLALASAFRIGGGTGD